MPKRYPILVVDDEEENLMVIQRYLKMEGYLVDTCLNPVEALKKLESENYKILITDLMMPEMSGVDLIREAKKLNGFIQVIVITGYVTAENIMMSFKYGANNCFFKPFTSLEVLKIEIDASIAKLKRVTEVLQERIKRK